MIFLWSARPSEKKELSNTFQESFSIDYGAYKSFLYKMKYHKHYAVCFEVFENTTPSKFVITLHTVTSLSAHCL